MKENLVQTRPGVYELEKFADMRVDARLFSSEKLLESLQDMTLQQVCNAASLPGACGCSIAMPDMHIGYGFCVGGVSAYKTDGGIISPGAIGFDINCGVRVLRTDLDVSQVQPLVEMILDVLAQRVPAGVGKQSSISLDVHELREVLKKGALWARENGYATDADLECTEEGGCFVGADPMKLSQRAQARGFSQLGTLGAGNHFLEIQVVDEILDTEVAEKFGITRKGQVVIMIHCGSRGVGHQVCTDYLRRIEKETPEIMEALPEKNLAYAALDSEIGQDYLKAMKAAANFAFCNRQIITHQIRKTFERFIPGCSVEVLYDVSHNIAKREVYEVDGVDTEVLVHRKGATRAFPAGHQDICEQYRDVGQPVLIHGSMGTSSYVLVGTQDAMKYAFGSSAHGAGRLLSRTEAKETFDGKTVSDELAQKNIVVHAESQKGIAEEAPGVYKDVDEVISVTETAGIAKAVARLKPLGVLKG